MDLIVEREAFFARQKTLLIEARQRLALQLSTGIDLAQLERFDCPACRALEARLVRLVERERQRGLTKHWSYDLNRHIAMTQALDAVRKRLEEAQAEQKNMRQSLRVRSPEEIAARRAKLRVAAAARRMARQQRMANAPR